MKIIHVTFALLAALLLCFAWLIWSGSPDGASGVGHAIYPAMRAGGDGMARLAQLGWLPFFIQLGFLGVFFSLVALSMGARMKAPLAKAGLLVLGIIAASVWYQVYAHYMAFLATGETDYIFGFPTASTWMLFGIWPAAALFSALYYVGYRTLIFSHEDEDKFNRLVEKYKANPSDQSTGET